MLGNNCIDGIREPKAGVQRAQPSAGVCGSPDPSVPTFPLFSAGRVGKKNFATALVECQSQPYIVSLPIISYNMSGDR